MAHTGFGIYIKAKNKKDALRIARNIETKEILTKSEFEDNKPFDYFNLERNEYCGIVVFSKGTREYKKETNNLLRAVKLYHCKGSNFVFDEIGKEYWKIKEARRISVESDFLVLGDGHD